MISVNRCRRTLAAVALLGGLVSGGLPAIAAGPLAPLKTESPRDTMQSFMEAMQDYKRGVETVDPKLIARLDDAVRCLDLSELPVLTRDETGSEAAIFLKEVIDRVIVIDYDMIPSEETEGGPPSRWRLKDTEITIVRMNSGEREGEFLFSADTVARAATFYEKVKHLPLLEGSGGGAAYREPWIERKLPSWAREPFLTVRVWQWIGLLVAIFIGLTMRAVAGGLMYLIQRLSSRTRSDWDEKMVEALKSPVGLLAATAIWFFALRILRLKDVALNVMNVILQILLAVGLIWLFYRLANVFGDYLRCRADRTPSKLDDQLVKLISNSLKTFIVIFGVLVCAQNLGIEVFSLLAGLGIGGLAVALAAKDTLANFFGSITIMLDRPFQVGHWIVIGDYEGTVEDIGFRTTKIRTFYNSVISVPNSFIATSGVDNMGMREYRRVLTTIDVTYDTPAEKMEAFLEGIKNIIKANPNTRKDYFHVVFNDFGDSGLKIMLYFFVKVPDWSTELVERQNVFLEITRLADELGVEFAFPTQTIHVETFPEKQPVRPPHEIDTGRFSSTAKQFGEGGDKARPGGSGLFTPPYKEQQ